MTIRRDWISESVRGLVVDSILEAVVRFFEAAEFVVAAACRFSLAARPWVVAPVFDGLPADLPEPIPFEAPIFSVRFEAFVDWLFPMHCSVNYYMAVESPDSVLGFFLGSNLVVWAASESARMERERR